MKYFGPLLSWRLHHCTNMSSFCYNNTQTMTHGESVFEYLEGLPFLRAIETEWDLNTGTVHDNNILNERLLFA